MPCQSHRRLLSVTNEMCAMYPLDQPRPIESKNFTTFLNITRLQSTANSGPCQFRRPTMIHTGREILPCQPTGRLRSKFKVLMRYFIVKRNNSDDLSWLKLKLSKHGVYNTYWRR